MAWYWILLLVIFGGSALFLVVGRLLYIRRIEDAYDRLLEYQKFHYRERVAGTLTPLRGEYLIGLRHDFEDIVSSGMYTNDNPVIVYIREHVPELLRTEE